MTKAKDGTLFNCCLNSLLYVSCRKLNKIVSVTKKNQNGSLVNRFTKITLKRCSRHDQSLEETRNKQLESEIASIGSYFGEIVK